MNLNETLLNETFITTAVFNDELVELTYMERRHQGSKSMRMQMLMFPVDGIDPEKVDIVAAIQDLLRELIDRVESEQREEMQETKKVGLRQALGARRLADATADGPEDVSVETRESMRRQLADVDEGPPYEV